MEKEVFLSDEKEPHVVFLTFEDWKKGKKGIWPNLYFDEPFSEKMVYSIEHEENNWYTLTKDEYQKIYDAQKEIFERNVGLYLEQLIKEFESFFRSKEVVFISSELVKINSLLEDKEYKGGVSFPNLNGKQSVPNLEQFFFGAKNIYFNEYVAKRKYPFERITWNDNPDYSLPLCVVVGVLVEYRKYLEGLLNGEPKKNDVAKWGHIEINTDFRKLFVSDEAMYRALDAALDLGVIDANGKWILGQRGHKSSFTGFWVALSKRDLKLTSIEANRYDQKQTVVQPVLIVSKQFFADIKEKSVYAYEWKNDCKWLTKTTRYLQK